MGGVLVAFSLAFGETITATSDVFSFPPLLGIKDGQNTGCPLYFKFSGASLKSHRAVFTWSLPATIKNGNGVIRIYSLLGRIVKTFPINARTGSIVWKMTPSEEMAGLCIARFSFGPYQQNFKLVFSR